MSWAVNTCLGIASDIESTSLLCWPSGAGATHRRRMIGGMSSQVCSLYRCESGWSKRVLDIHTIWIAYINPTAMVHGVSSLMPISVQIWCSLIGAERPKTWGGSTQKLGRIDRVWGGRGAGRLWGGSSVSRRLHLPPKFVKIRLKLIVYCTFVRILYILTLPYLLVVGKCYISAWVVNREKTYV